MSDARGDPPTAAASGALGELAEAHGVATTYIAADDVRVTVPADTVRAALAAMGVDAGSDAAARAALRAHRAAEADRLLPDSHVARQGRPDTYAVPVGAADEVGLTLEDGSTRELPVAAPLRLPADLPLGYHRVHARAAGREATTTLVVAPEGCPVPDERSWGWMTQVYQLRSRRSWGMGDARDLRALAERSAAELGAGFVVCNPLHAVAPVPPVEPSPYFPSSRRFANPLYLRIDDVPETSRLDPTDRARVDAIATRAEQLNHGDRIDYDAILAVKLEALHLIHRAAHCPAREADFAAYRDRQGRGLADFATFCALAERHGVPWQGWPDALRHPDAPAVSAARGELAERVAFHAWLQWLLAEQLTAAQQAATGAGMPIGIVHDLAVGVDPGGADAWALQEDLAGAVRVGAPPDAFNQRGQDWSQPPLRPDRLLATGFRPFRDMLRGVLAHGGGVRIDHVLGFFRLYWIPEGRPATEGTYVRYPGDALLGVLALEAQRADALVIGEDLGTVEEGVRDRLRDAGVMGSRVLYFERDTAGEPAASSDYPRLALSSVTTHDLPTAAGWWRAEAVRLRAELGLLAEGRSEAEERRHAAEERSALRSLLRAEGLVDDDADERALIVAMHALLARTPSLLVAAAPADAIGDVRQPNLPGTSEEYPNWRLPLAEPGPLGPQPISLERFLEHPGTRRVAEAIRG